MKRALSRKIRPRPLGEEGQTMIEFILVVMIIFTILCAFLQLAWALAWGHYIHYATFMSARAYFAGHETKQEQLANATEVLQKMVKTEAGADLLGRLAPSLAGDERDIQGDEPIPGSFIGTHPFAAGQDMTIRSFSWAEGVQFNFHFKLFFIPFARIFMADNNKTIRIGPRGDQRNITWNGWIRLVSDAFLGREASATECREFLERLQQSIPRGDGRAFMYDNGC